MSAQRTAGSGTQRGLLVGLVGGAFALLLVSYGSEPTSNIAKPARATPSAIDRWEAAPVQPLPDDEQQRSPAAKRDMPAAPIAAPVREQPVAVTFSFLGKVEEQGRPVVVLQGGGRTLKVHGPGRIDSDYVVDTVQDAYVIVRHERLGSSQLVELTAARRPIDPGWTAADSPQD